jgi:dTDP-glucose 4,6-dehydratase
MLLEKLVKMYKPKNILVTGGAGFIGCNFVRHLLEMYDDIQVINYDKLTYAGNLDNLKNLPNAANYHFVQGDICDRQKINEVLRQYSIDTIIHFAAESHVDRSITGPAEFIQTNVVGTFTLLEAARQFWLEEKKWDSTQCRFHHISTDEVFGTLGPNDPPFVETTAYAPNSPYSASKASSDHLVRAYFHTYGLPMTMTNCSNNYGSYQHAEKLIPTIIRSCKEWKPIPIYGDGSNIRDWLHVDDHCRAIDLVVREGTLGQSYNVGGNCEKSNLEVVNTICQLMDQCYPQKQKHETLITFVKDRKGHDWRYAIDGSKLKQKLGWSAQVKFSEGIKRLLKENCE